MKNIYSFLIALTALISAHPVKAQTYTLDLGSSFSPAWTAAGTGGTANNIGSSGINCTVSMALTGSGSIVSPYPRVNNNNSNGSDFVVQGSTDALEVDIDLGNKTSYVDITFAFSAPVQNVSFAVSDIDMPGGSSPYAYVDQVTVSGTGSAGTIAPVLTKYNTSSAIFNIAANMATGNTGAGGGNVSSLQLNNSTQDGTMFVNFNGNAVNTITIRYNTLNAANVSSNPSLQAIAFGNISFKKAVAPVAANITNPAIVNTNGATAIAALSGTDDESVASYTIATLPPAASGVLLYNNGTSYVAVTAGQVLTPAQAASLKFDPLATYMGNALFTYTATDNRGLVSNTSNYTIMLTSSLLPVTLTNFSGAWNNNSVTLSWTTQQEFNSSAFIVEKSNDGINWQVVTVVAAAHNSSTAKNYSAADAQPFAVTYYRLKQVDADGAYDYSKVIKITNTGNNNLTVKVFPNPVTTSATITTISTGNKSVSIKLFSNNGMLVKEITKQVTSGINNIDIPAVSLLPNGIYTVTINDNGNNKPLVARFIKQ
jgi:hypothetical protein